MTRVTKKELKIALYRELAMCAVSDAMEGALSRLEVDFSDLSISMSQYLDKICQETSMMLHNIADEVEYK